MERFKLRERRVYPDPALPAAIYRLGGTGHLLDAHWHPDLEILYVAKGPVVFTIEGERVATETGSAVVVNVGELHTAEAFGPDAAEVRAIVFDPAFLCGPEPDACSIRYLDPLRAGRSRLPRLLRPDCAADAEPLASLERLVDLMDCPKPAYELHLKALFLQWLGVLAADGRLPVDPTRNPRSDRYDSIRKSLAVIHDRYAGKITVPELAAAANLSEFHFYRVFHEATGRSPIEYLNEYRCRRAALLLSDTDAGILGIALDVGFSGAAHFIRIFRRHYGTTPSRYRKGLPIDRA